MSHKDTFVKLYIVTESISPPDDTLPLISSLVIRPI